MHIFKYKFVYACIEAFSYFEIMPYFNKLYFQLHAYTHVYVYKKWTKKYSPTSNTKKLPLCLGEALVWGSILRLLSSFATKWKKKIQLNSPKIFFTRIWLH